MRADETKPGGQRSTQHEGCQHQCHHWRRLQCCSGWSGHFWAYSPAWETLGWPRGRTRYCDYDGLCQHVQVRAVSTKAQAAAGTCLILRQTLGCEERNQEFSALVILGLVSQGS